MRSVGGAPRSPRVLSLLALVEDAIYVVIALFLIGSGALLLFSAGRDLVTSFDVGNIHSLIVRVLDETLLVFMVVELLHTVRVTLREHRLVVEPFLVVGLIAGVRRILILTANTETIQSGPGFVVYWVQLLLLIVLVVAMVAALFIWRRTSTTPGEPE